MSEYIVRIERISQKHHYGLRYLVTVSWDGVQDNMCSFRDWSFTLWGARRSAKAFIKKLNDKEPEPILIEEYKA